MATARTKMPRRKTEGYFELIRRFPLRPIRDDRELDGAIKMIDMLVDRPRLNKAEEDYLDVLGDLVDRYARSISQLLTSPTLTCWLI